MLKAGCDLPRGGARDGLGISLRAHDQGKHSGRRKCKPLVS
jgi:hypothetical protein